VEQVAYNPYCEAVYLYRPTGEYCGLTGRILIHDDGTLSHYVRFGHGGTMPVHENQLFRVDGDVPPAFD
jgi:hypothetical protein